MKQPTISTSLRIARESPGVHIRNAPAPDSTDDRWLFGTSYFVVRMDNAMTPAYRLVDYFNLDPHKEQWATIDTFGDGGISPPIDREVDPANLGGLIQIETANDERAVLQRFGTMPALVRDGQRTHYVFKIGGVVNAVRCDFIEWILAHGIADVGNRTGYLDVPHALEKATFCARSHLAPVHVFDARGLLGLVMPIRISQ